MAKEEETPEDGEKKPSAMGGLIFGVISAVVLFGAAAGAIFVSPFGKAPDPSALTCEVEEHNEEEELVVEEEERVVDYRDLTYVKLEPMVISLGPKARANHLKISISLETTEDNVKELEHLRPRFRDVLNTYLRAVNERDIIEPAGMVRLRAQMLRRVELVASSNAVHDILITEFVLN